MLIEKFKVKKVLYSGSRPDGQDFKFTYCYEGAEISSPAEFYLKCWKLPRSYYNDKKQGIYYPIQHYQRFTKEINPPRGNANRAQIRRQISDFKDRKLSFPDSLQFTLLEQAVTDKISKMQRADFPPLVGWGVKKNKYKFIGAKRPIFADITFNYHAPTIEDTLSPILFWYTTPAILPTVAYSLFAYTNFDQWIDRDGDFRKYVGESNFVLPTTLTNISNSPQMDIALQYIFANSFFEKEYSIRKIPYRCPHTLLGYEDTIATGGYSSHYNLRNLVLQKQIPLVTNAVLDAWDESILLYPCLYTTKNALKYSRAEAAMEGHIICQLPTRIYTKNLKPLLAKKNIETLSGIWWYYIYHFLVDIKNDLNDGSGTSDYGDYYTSPLKLRNDSSTPPALLNMIDSLKSSPAHLALLLIFFSFLQFLHDDPQELGTKEYMTSNRVKTFLTSCYEQLQISLSPIYSSFQLFCQYLRDILVAQCVTPTYLHWEGVEHSGKENCYYLDAHAWFAEFEKYAEIKLNRTEVQSAISGLLKLRPNRRLWVITAPMKEKSAMCFAY